MQLGHTLKADGRWRLIIFGGNDPTSSSAPVHHLCAFLAENHASPIKTDTPKDADVDSVIVVGAVFQQPRALVKINDLSSILTPQKGQYKLRDLEKVFCDKESHNFGHGHIYEKRGIDKEKGCVTVVRPDQYVVSVLPLDATVELAAFFDGLIILQNS